MRYFLFELKESLRTAVQALWANKLRSLLTTLGIVIGIVSVTSMMTIINGIDHLFEETLSQFGADVLYVQKFPWNVGSFDWWNYINRPPIDEELVEIIQKRSDYTEEAIPFQSTSRTVQHGSEHLQGVSVEGSTPAYAYVQDLRLASGRFFTPAENQAASNVCVIGQAVASSLFPVGRPLEKAIRVGQHPCQVIGVLEKEGTGLGGAEQDLRVVIPFSTYKRRFGINPWSGIDIMVKVKRTDQMERAKDELTGILRVARQVDPKAESNFAINQQETLRRQMQPVKWSIYGVGLFLTALSLLVGGIGVMNIMFVSIKERTREIGIRKAVGARRRTILLQFLVEAVLVCLIAGLIGVALAFALKELINALAFPARLPLGTVGLAFGICFAIGLVFGLAPAWQAATSEPVEALSYE